MSENITIEIDTKLNVAQGLLFALHSMDAGLLYFTDFTLTESDGKCVLSMTFTKKVDGKQECKKWRDLQTSFGGKT